MPDAERSGRRQGHRRNNAAVKGQKPIASSVAAGSGHVLCWPSVAARARPGSRLRRPSCSRPSRYGIGSSTPTFRPPKWLEQCESDGTWTRLSAWGKAVDGETRVCPCAESVDCSGARWVRLTRCKVCLKGATRDTNAASFDTVSRRTLCPSVVRNAMATWSNESYEHGCCVTRGCHVRRRRRRMLPGSAPLRVDRLQCEDDVRSREGRAGDGSEALRANLRSKAEDGCQCVTGLASLAKAAWLDGCGRAIPEFFPTRQTTRLEAC